MLRQYWWVIWKVNRSYLIWKKTYQVRRLLTYLCMSVLHWILLCVGGRGDIKGTASPIKFIFHIWLIAVYQMLCGVLHHVHAKCQLHNLLLFISPQIAKSSIDSNYSDSHLDHTNTKKTLEIAGKAINHQRPLTFWKINLFMQPV